MIQKILKLKPAIKSYIWGGDRLKTEFNKHSYESVVAETWELSCHFDGPSVIDNGDFAGKTLNEYINIYGNVVLGANCKKYSEFPILIKFIDAKNNLSIQVHPDDDYALKKENQFGKTEMWYIIDAKKGAYLYYGLNKNVTTEELKRHIENNTLLDILNKVYVKKGDVFFIEAGTIHAICSDILIAEIQQSSNVTYRVYDYDRKDQFGNKRELHIKKSLDVISKVPMKGNYDFGNCLAKCNYFQVEKIEVDKYFENTAETDTFHSLLFIDGEGFVKTGDEYLKYQKGDSFFIEAGTGKYMVEGNGYFILTTIPH